MRIADTALLYVLLALGLNIVVGYAGLLDLGYGAFYAVGAYIFGLLASPHLTDTFPAIAAMFPDGLHLPLLVVIPLSALVADVVQSVLPQARVKKLRIAHTTDPGSADMLVADPTRIRQILFNLIGNALKFTEAGGISVHVRTQPIGSGQQRVTIAVRDTGIGMDAETQGRLFQPFAQADSSTTRRFGGSGLGLSIVRDVAFLHGGELLLDNRAEGGLCATLRLPRR